MSVKRYNGQPLPVTVGFKSNPFTVYNKDYSDIVEVYMNLKKDLINDADDAYMQQTQAGGGVVIDQANHKFSMDMDYTNLVVGEKYKVVIAVDLGIGGDLVELKLHNESRTVEITPDENRL